MPKILEKSLEEKERDEQFRKSVAIVEQMVGTHHVSTDEDYHIIGVHNDSLLVYSAYNTVHVKHPDQFDLAYDLAERCEQILGIEYSIKKKY